LLWPELVHERKNALGKMLEDGRVTVIRPVGFEKKAKRERSQKNSMLETRNQERRKLGLRTHTYCTLAETRNHDQQGSPNEV
jgi:hypothetical protein